MGSGGHSISPTTPKLVEWIAYFGGRYSQSPSRQKIPLAGTRDMALIFLGERLGSGDGERKTLLTRQIAFEPLPASVLFGLVRGWMVL